MSESYLKAVLEGSGPRPSTCSLPFPFLSPFTRCRRLYRTPPKQIAQESLTLGLVLRCRRSSGRRATTTQSYEYATAHDPPLSLFLLTPPRRHCSTAYITPPAAVSFNISTIYLADVAPQLAQTVDPVLSFSSFSTNITTLSGNSASSAIDVTGLLYVPDLNSSDPCAVASSHVLPHNVTRRADLPHKPYYLIAIAPWINASCTLDYLAAASGDPIRGFVFFNPAGDADSLPKAGNGHYDLEGGNQWKWDYHFPVYAISGAYGSELVRASSLYSGNITQAPNGPKLSELYDPRSYIRLYIDIDTGEQPLVHP